MTKYKENYLNYHFIKNRTEILVDMQHYIEKTRLMDWTFSPLVALYFALRNNQTTKSSLVYVFDAWKYHKKNFKPKIADNHSMHLLGRSLLSDRMPNDIEKVLKKEFYGSFLSAEDLKLPFPFVAKYGNPRIINQSGCFVIYGTDKISMNKSPEFVDYLQSIEIQNEIGGPQEVAAGEFAKENMSKPVIAYIAGLTAPKGKVMGHAGAIVSAYGESAVEKVELLKECGVTISKNPSIMGDTVKSVLEKLT